MTPRARRYLSQWVPPLASGAVAALGQAPFGFLPALALGFAAGFWLWSRCADARQAAWFGWRFGTGYFAVTLLWIVEPFLIEPEVFGWMAPFALLFMAGGLALFWGLAGFVGRKVGGSGIAYAGALAGGELLRAYVFTGFPWALASQGLVDWAAYQVAAWIGPHGVNLAFLVWCAAIPLVMSRRWIVFPLAITAAAGVFLPIPKADTEGVPIARVIQPNATQELKWTEENVRKFFDRQVALTAIEADQQPDLVVWPETAVPFLLEYADPPLRYAAARAHGAELLVGIQRSDGYNYFNSAVLVTPEGKVDAVYDKYHLVPFGEYMPFQALFDRFGITGLAAIGVGGYSAGTGPKLVTAPGFGKVLPLICYEAIFPQNIFAAPRPDVIVHLTNDAWFGKFSGPYQHLAIVRMRAIEAGLSVIRSANTGISAVIDPYGNVLGAIPLGQQGMLDMPVPTARKATLYSRTGDWLGLGLILMIVATAFQFRGPISVDADAAEA